METEELLMEIAPMLCLELLEVTPGFMMLHSNMKSQIFLSPLGQDILFLDGIYHLHLLIQPYL